MIFSSNVQLLRYRQKGKWIFRFNMNWGCVTYVEQREKQAKNFSEYSADYRMLIYNEESGG